MHVCAKEGGGWWAGGHRRVNLADPAPLNFHLIFVLQSVEIIICLSVPLLRQSNIELLRSSGIQLRRIPVRDFLCDAPALCNIQPLFLVWYENSKHYEISNQSGNIYRIVGCRVEIDVRSRTAAVANASAKFRMWNFISNPTRKL